MGVDTPGSAAFAPGVFWGARSASVRAPSAADRFAVFIPFFTAKFGAFCGCKRVFLCVLEGRAVGEVEVAGEEGGLGGSSSRRRSINRRTKRGRRQKNL